MSPNLLPILVMLTTWLFVITFVYSRKLNIALHAQVMPNDDINGKIVGSVITTDGLRSALDERGTIDVGKTAIFYPYSYSSFFDTDWDLIVIEGWFPMMHEFIQLTRSKLADVIILFFCLDPNYPGIQVMLHFDVDGILTNSKQLELQLKSTNHFISGTKVKFQPHVQFLMLAADEKTMRPMPNVTRSIGSVYVGAGGHMLQYKPNLLDTLKRASAHGLEIYGNAWADVEDVKSFWKGILPRYQIAEAYAGAHVVLAQTIAEQASYGMINNRIFEALSCGCVVISDYSDALKEVAGDVLFLANDSIQAETFLIQALQSADLRDKMQTKARQFILQGHTWGHRAVELLDFFWHVKWAKRSSERRIYADDAGIIEQDKIFKERHMPTMAWIVSDALQHHLDYVHVINSYVYASFAKRYMIVTFSESNWLKLVSSGGDGGGQDSNLTNLKLKIDLFDVIMIIATPFDPLDLSTMLLPPSLNVQGKDRFQKRCIYMLGYNSKLVKDYLIHQEAQGIQKQAALDLRARVYDLVLFRDYHEMKLLEASGLHTDPMRIQHMFASYAEIPFVSSEQWSTSSTEDSDSHRSGNKHSVYPRTAVAVCYFEYKSLCSQSARNSIIDPKDRDTYILLLLGGTWSDWISPLDSNKENENDQDMNVLNVDILHRVVHVKEGRTGAAQHLITHAGNGTVYNFHGVWEGGVVQVDSFNPSEKEEVQANTVNDTIWPVVAFCARATYNSRSRVNAKGVNSVAIEANSGDASDSSDREEETIDQSGRLHFLEWNDHIISIVSNENCESWDREYLEESVYKAILRLHGLGTSRTKVHIGVWDILYNSIDVAPSASSEPMEEESPVIVLKTNIEDFVLGRDGQFCVHANGVLLRCFLRNFDYLVLKLQGKNTTKSSSSTSAVDLTDVNPSDSSNMSSSEPSQYSFNVSMYLMGNMLLDQFQKWTCDFHLNKEVIKQEARQQPHNHKAAEFITGYNCSPQGGPDSVSADLHSNSNSLLKNRLEKNKPTEALNDWQFKTSFVMTIPLDFL